jgi:pimeloyl-ACP methyl ester carboxylesterase
MEQEIRFCTTADGVRLAYAAAGSGSPLVKTANWLNHLEYDWESPAWRHVLTALADRYRLLRYDERGNGLSDWDADEISFEAFVRDLETVVDAAGLTRFPLFGISQGCSVSIAFAVRHPERVSRLVLFGGYARGWSIRNDPTEIEERKALLTLVRKGWGKENPAFRQVFTSLFLPEGTPEQMAAFNELQRVTTSPENAVRLIEAFSKIDVMDLLPQVNVPTLVVHCRNDARVPIRCGREIASGIPGARFVSLDSRNHLPLEHEPAWRKLIDEMTAFLDEDADISSRSPAGTREPTGSWDEADRLFNEALDLPEERRGDWLRERCGSRPALHAQVERLLQWSSQGGGALATGGALDGDIGMQAFSEGPALEPGSRLGPYEVHERIGSGGMGTVYRASHEKLGRDVAIKALAGGWHFRTDMLKRFEREARVLASLDHPNVATVHDYMVVEDRPYLVLELVDGETLTERIARGPIPIEQAREIAAQVTDALAEAHDRNVVHRDLKPGNIKITERGRVKVLDFGLAKTVEATRADPSASSIVTTSIAVLGTPAYMSPEQARGIEIDIRADIWAFGCVLFEMLTAEPIFAAASVSDSIAAVLRDEPDLTSLPPETPPELARLIRQCLQKDLAERPQTIDQVRSLLHGP